MEKIRKSETDKQTALNYFIRGLTAAEIEKLTDIPRRTLEGYSMRENWKAQRAAEKQRERLKMFQAFRKVVERKRKECLQGLRNDLDKPFFNEIEKGYKDSIK